ncbi:MAG: hypothetical protein KDC13_04440 [Bacteroidetes bacterium]|nr:hypothetical protein [Bacteroidota bacterium]
MIMLLLVFSCKKDPVEPPVIPVNPEAGNRVLVLNEGNFQWGNAGTTLIEISSGAVTQNLFEKINNRPLGDVLQSAYLNNELFLVVNNSQKIERMSDAQSIAGNPITGFQSPRYIVKSNYGYFVSDLYANRLFHLNNSFEMQAGIPLNGWGEEMLCDDGEQVFVCNVSSGYLMKLNASTGVFTDSVQLGDSPKSIVSDTQSRLWVLCEGSIYPDETAGSIWCVDPENMQVIFSKTFENTEHPSRLQIRKEGSDTLYFLKNGVYKMPLSNFNVPATPLINEGSELFYGLGVDAKGNIWVSNAKDYVQAGEVYRYNYSGHRDAVYEAGIIPSGFVFY